MYIILGCSVYDASPLFPTLQCHAHFKLCRAGLERNRTRKAKRNTPIRVMT